MSLTKYFEAYHHTGFNQNKNTTVVSSEVPSPLEDNFTIYLRIKPILANPLET
jgi:hypothetical protein